MSTILVGCTIPAFKMTDHWSEWLENADAITHHAHKHGHAVKWIAVLQRDARGDDPFLPLLLRMSNLQAQGLDMRVWRFSLDTGDEEITSGNRFAGICTGRNLIIEAGLRDRDVEWIYFADSDISAPDDLLPRLLDTGHPVVGGHVPTYCLGNDAPRLAQFPGDSREHWTTAGSLLVHRDVFRRVPWRWDPDAGETDDPATQSEMKRLGFPTIVRHDVICEHNPRIIFALEHRGHDLRVYR